MDGIMQHVFEGGVKKEHNEHIRISNFDYSRLKGNCFIMYFTDNFYIDGSPLKESPKSFKTSPLRGRNKLSCQNSVNSSLNLFNKRLKNPIE